MVTLGFGVLEPQGRVPQRSVNTVARWRGPLSAHRALMAGTPRHHPHIPCMCHTPLPPRPDPHPQTTGPGFFRSGSKSLLPHVCVCMWQVWGRIHPFPAARASRPRCTLSTNSQPDELPESHGRRGQDRPDSSHRGHTDPRGELGRTRPCAQGKHNARRRGGGQGRSVSAPSGAGGRGRGEGGAHPLSTPSSAAWHLRSIQ